MKSFPDFMKNPINKVDASQQNTADIEGYYFQGADETQIAFWECHADRISQKHTHPFDELAKAGSNWLKQGRILIINY